MLDFTIGLTEGVAWPWPIAVYLFLAGISGGAVAVAICVNLFRGVHLNTPIMKAATLIGFITIVLGMRMMGAMLISSLVIFPALTSMRVFKSFLGVVVSSGVVSVVCFFIGLILSYVYSIPAGASVVVVNLAMFGVFSVVQMVKQSSKGRNSRMPADT